MRNSSHAAAADPWAADIDNGWRDLVISSAPPPPPREATEPASAKNRMLPADLRTWQEHGAPRVPSGEHAVDEVAFAGDRRLWFVAGTLMAMAAMVLALLGYLTFGSTSAAVVDPTPAPTAAAAPATPAQPEAAVRHVERHHAAAAASSARPSKHTKHTSRRHKR